MSYKKFPLLIKFKIIKMVFNDLTVIFFSKIGCNVIFDIMELLYLFNFLMFMWVLKSIYGKITYL